MVERFQLPAKISLSKLLTSSKSIAPSHLASNISVKKAFENLRLSSRKIISVYEQTFHISYVQLITPRGRFDKEIGLAFLFLSNGIAPSNRLTTWNIPPRLWHKNFIFLMCNEVHYKFDKVSVNKFWSTQNFMLRSLSNAIFSIQRKLFSIKLIILSFGWNTVDKKFF